MLLFFLVSGHGSQVLAPPDHVEETDGYDEGQRAAHANIFEISNVPCVVLWPCDVQFFSESDRVENYILDDVSGSPPISFLVSIHLLGRMSRKF